MRVLVTGGFGFLGGRIAQHLQRAGHRIVLGSRSAHAAPDWLLSAEVAQTTWTDASALERPCHGVDVIVHAAGMNARDCAAHPARALEVNGTATAMLLQAASAQRVRRMLYLSTAHVYGDPLSGPITEATSARNTHPYATSHLAGEAALSLACQRHGMQGVVLRLSNVVGAPSHPAVDCWTLLVNDLCRQAVLTRTLVLRSDGSSERDFLAMADLCGAVEHLATHDAGPGTSQLYNVGSGVSATVLEMARLVQQRCLATLGFEPELHRGGADEAPTAQALHFGVGALAEAGFRPSGEISAEVDELLRFCRASATPASPDGS